MKKEIPINIDFVGKIPPQAIDIEEAILGGLMLDRDAIYKINIQPSYFYKDSHQKIFEAILALNNKNQPIDQLTVTEELRKSDRLEEIGGPYFVSQLTSNVASAYNIEYHSLIITEKFLKREVIRLASEFQSRAFDDSEDVFDIIDSLNTEVDKINNNTFEDDGLKPFSELIKETINKAVERNKLNSQGKTIGIRTPIYKLTKWTNGWQKKDLIILAGRPGMGKTAFALSIMKDAATDGINVCLFSLEMDSVSLAGRVLVGHSGINADGFKSGSIQNYEWESIDKSASMLMKLPILIDDKPKSISKIKSKAKNLHRKGKCDMIILDYLQLASDDLQRKGGNREQEISEISRKAKSIAMELDIPVIVLSQLNRAVENRSGMKRPQLSDLRESGAIEQDADIVIFLNRPEYYGFKEDENNEPLNGRCECIIAKHRNGQTGIVEFKFNESITSVIDFENQPTEVYDINKTFEPNKEFDNKAPY